MQDLEEELRKIAREIGSQTDLNEDGVPINEQDATDYWRSYANHWGIYTVRIENIGSSLPDLLMIYKGLSIFQEIKVRRGNLIYAPSFQWSNLNRLSKELHDWQLIYVVYNRGVFDLYEYQAIKRLPDTMIKGTNYGKVSMNLSTITPFMSVDSRDSFENYIRYVHFKAFKKPLP